MARPLCRSVFGTKAFLWTNSGITNHTIRVVLFEQIMITSVVSSARQGTLQAPISFVNDEQKNVCELKCILVERNSHLPYLLVSSWCNFKLNYICMDKELKKTLSFKLEFLVTFNCVLFYFCRTLLENYCKNSTKYSNFLHFP